MRGVLRLGRLGDRDYDPLYPYGWGLRTQARG
jgi:hypothetical protein